jgi:flagellar biogenesis protein FliO
MKDIFVNCVLLVGGVVCAVLFILGFVFGSRWIVNRIEEFRSQGFRGWRKR